MTDGQLLPHPSPGQPALPTSPLPHPQQEPLRASGFGFGSGMLEAWVELGACGEQLPGKLALELFQL